MLRAARSSGDPPDRPLPAQSLALALLVLRITLGVFVLQWGIEKLVVPNTTIAIFRNFYRFELGALLPPVLGGLQVALSLAFLAGIAPRLTYGVVLLLHRVTVLVTIPRLMAPWNPVSNHFFIAGVPVWAGFFALHLLRNADLYGLPRLRRPAMPGSARLARPSAPCFAPREPEGGKPWPSSAS